MRVGPASLGEQVVTARAAGWLVVRTAAPAAVVVVVASRPTARRVRAPPSARLRVVLFMGVVSPSGPEAEAACCRPLCRRATGGTGFHKIVHTRPNMNDVATRLGALSRLLAARISYNSVPRLSREPQQPRQSVTAFLGRPSQAHGLVLIFREDPVPRMTARELAVDVIPYLVLFLR